MKNLLRFAAMALAAPAIVLSFAGCLAAVPVTPVTPGAEEEETSDPGGPIADIVRDARRQLLGVGQGSP